MAACERRGYESTYKILILGNISVGKTCLMYRYCDGVYHENYISTIGIDCMSRVVDVDNMKIKLQIWDTAGQERYRTLTQAYYRGAHGIILVYDVTNERTFHDLVGWMSNIEQMASPQCCKVIVGNKADSTVPRQVMPERGHQLAESVDVDFFEISCKTYKNVEEMFLTLTRKIRTMQNSLKSRYSTTHSIKELTHWQLADDDESKCACVL